MQLRFVWFRPARELLGDEPGRWAFEPEGVSLLGATRAALREGWGRYVEILPGGSGQIALPATEYAADLTHVFFFMDGEPGLLSEYSFCIHFGSNEGSQRTAVWNLIAAKFRLEREPPPPDEPVQLVDSPYVEVVDPRLNCWRIGVRARAPD
jgi:hypothetical protein